MTLQDMNDAGILLPYLRRGKVETIEHCLDSLRGTDKYKWLKAKVEDARGAKVRVINDSVRIASC